LTFLSKVTFAEEPKTHIDIQISAGDWPPFLSESLPGQGIVASLIRDVFYEVGYRVEFVFLPWNRAYQVAAVGEYSATGVWMFKQDRTDDFLYSDPVLDEKFVLFHLKESEFEWNDFSDLSGKVIGGGLGYSYGPMFDKALEEGVFELIRVPKVEQNLRMLAAGRVDLYAEELSVAKYNMLKNTPELTDLISYHPKPISINQSFLLFPKDAPQSRKLIELFNERLKIYRQDGRYDEYFE
jgi:polar amino acid transport system substrate-binding protein